MKTTFKYIVLGCLLTGITMLSGCKKEPGIPTLNTTNVSGVTLNTAVISGFVTSDGGADVLTRGVCWSTVPNPTIADYAVSAGAGLGSFTASITGLLPNTTYYVRVYARNSEGINYGNEVTFSTGPASLPALTTSVVAFVKATTAVSGGYVTNDGGGQITVKGVCWSTAHNPTITDGVTIGEKGSGPYTSNITGLTPNTTYYARAYATNSAGTSYGNEVSFVTSMPIPPTLTTVLLQATTTSASVGGNITDIGDGVGEIIDRGVCWSTAPLPTIEDKVLSSGVGLSSFTINLNNLNPGTTYFVRAWAINSTLTDVFYGNQISFIAYPPAGESTSEFPGGTRYEQISFSIGTKVYLGLGLNGGDFTARDFWEWDQVTNLWTKLADFPGNSVGGGVGFSIGTKGYVGIESYVNNTDLRNEFWEYDPATNTWKQKASIPTTPARAYSVGFSIGTKGYIGLGIKDQGGSTTDYFKDFWEWDQATDVWTRKADFEGNTRAGGVGFSIGNKGYIATGSDGTSYTKDFWEWDQATNLWTKKADFGGEARAYAVGFSIGNKGYVGTGYNGRQTLYLYQDFWEWDQTTDTWTRKGDFAGGPRSGAFGVSAGNKAYIGTGMGGSIIYAFQDFWEIDPNLK